ncbi:hypothetical protein HDU67_001840, partial [Dinochytrium kinnereticum]
MEHQHHSDGPRKMTAIDLSESDSPPGRSAPIEDGSTGGMLGKAKKKMRPLSNIFSSITSKQKEAAGMRRYTKLQKEAKNSMSNNASAGRISEEADEPGAIRRSMDIRSTFFGSNNRDSGHASASEPVLPSLTYSHSSESVSIEPRTSPLNGSSNGLSQNTTLHSDANHATIPAGRYELLPASQNLSPQDASHSTSGVRKRTSMASLFTLGDRADRSSDDESGSSDSRPPNSFIGRDSDQSEAEEDIDALIKAKFSVVADDDRLALENGHDHREVPQTPLATMDMKLPPRPSSPGVDDLEPDIDLPIKSAPSSVRSLSQNSVSSRMSDSYRGNSLSISGHRTLNHKTTHEILISLPPRPSSPGVEDLDAPSATTIKQRSSSPNHIVRSSPRSSPEPMLTVADASRNKTRTLSSSASILSIASSIASAGSSPSTLTPEAAAAAAAAEAANRERLASISRRSELSVAARLSGVVSRHMYVQEAKKSGGSVPLASSSSTSSVQGAASKFFGSFFGGERPASPSSIHSTTSNGSLNRTPSLVRERSYQPPSVSSASVPPQLQRSGSMGKVSSSLWSGVPVGMSPSLSASEIATDSAMSPASTGSGNASGKNKLDNLMGMLMVEADEEEGGMDEEDLIAAEEVRRIRAAFEAEERLQALNQQEQDFQEDKGAKKDFGVDEIVDVVALRLDRPSSSESSAETAVASP